MEQIMLNVEESKEEKINEEVTPKEEQKVIEEPKETIEEPKEEPKDKKEIEKEEREKEKARIKEEKEKAKLIIDELKEKIVNDIQTKTKDYKENVTIKNTTKYTGVRYKGKVIAELEQVGRGLIIRVLDIYGDNFPSEANDYVTKEGENDLLIKKCPNRFGWRTNTELLLQNKKQYKQCFEALKMSIDIQKKELELKEKAKKEKTKKDDK